MAVTTLGATPAPAGRLSRLRPVRGGMEANALTLMVSSVTTGVLGVLYWVVAERLFPTDVVGRAAALTSTATMVSSLAGLSLGGSYQRFLPVAGHRSRRLVLAGLGFTAAVGLLFGGILSGFDLGAAGLFESGTERWLFPMLVAVLTVYALLDSVFIGLRRPGAVAWKNIGLSVLKLGPLPLVAGLGSFALVSSWGILAALVTTVTMVPLLRTWLRRTAGEPDRLPPLRRIWAFQGMSLTMLLVQTVTPLMLPLIVLGLLGPESAAYYNLVASVVVAAALLRAGVLSSYVVEASRNPAERDRLNRRMVRMLVITCSVSSVGLAVGGPLLLWITGEHYLTNAWLLMLLLAAEVVVAGITAAYTGVAQVVQRLRLIIVVQVVAGVITVAGAFVLVPWWGLAGFGAAALLSQTVAALVVIGPLLRQLRADARAHVADPRGEGR